LTKTWGIRSITNLVSALFSLAVIMRKPRF
jgi:hypothetical protein